MTLFGQLVHKAAAGCYAVDAACHAARALCDVLQCGQKMKAIDLNGLLQQNNVQPYHTYAIQKGTSSERPGNKHK
jgi:hypothetical protein